MREQLEILEVSARFLNTFGYVGVALLLFALAYYLRVNAQRTAFHVTGTLGLTFLLIFGALDIVTRHFPHLIISRAPLLTGAVVGVPQDLRIALVGGDPVGQRPFMRREYDSHDPGIANHRFIFSRNSFPCVLVAATPPGPSREARIFAVPVRPPAGARLRPEDELFIKVKLDAPVVSARWLRQGEPMGASVPGREQGAEDDGCGQDASPTPGADARGPLRRLLGIGTALAQLGVPPPAQLQALPLEATEKLLQSEDPFVRRQARRNLGALGQQAEPALDALLQQPNYRSRLGAVEAITAMPPEVRGTLATGVLQRVEELRHHADPTLSGAAIRALQAR